MATVVAISPSSWQKPKVSEHVYRHDAEGLALPNKDTPPLASSPLFRARLHRQYETVVPLSLPRSSLVVPSESFVFWSLT